jgi:hypothetical protein
MIITGKSLHRRTFLRGIGATVSLPFLDAMTPALASAARTAGEPVCRMAFVYVPNGIIMKDWVPASEGAAFELTRIMQPLAPYREQMLVMSGLAHINGRALGDGPGDHARAASTYLTGVHPKKTEGSDIRLGISVDQVAAQELGAATQFASLELGLESSGMVGNCDSGYSCAYSNSIAWRSPTTPLPPEINPRAVFERLFGDDETTDPAVRSVHAREDRSILDFVRDDSARLQGKLGAGDRRKLGEYLDALRDIERRIQRVEANIASGAALPSVDKPGGIPVTFEEHAKLMFDLQVIAFQADLTRVITFMIGREGSNRTYRSIGVPDAHHGISHHQYNAEKIEKLTKINVHHAEMLAYFLGKLQATQDGGGSLLDHSMVVYGSGLSDGNQHLHHDLPVVVAGGGAGRLRGGRHLKFKPETPMTNLYLSLLDKLGVRPERIGDSTGKIEHLSDV